MQTDTVVRQINSKTSRQYIQHLSDEKQTQTDKRKQLRQLDRQICRYRQRQSNKHTDFGKHSEYR